MAPQSVSLGDIVHFSSDRQTKMSEFVFFFFVRSKTSVSFVILSFEYAQYNELSMTKSHVHVLCVQFAVVSHLQPGIPRRRRHTMRTPQKRAHGASLAVHSYIRMILLFR